MRRLDTAQILPLIAPVHVLILSVIVLPACYVVWLSLSASTFGQAPTFVGLRNYIEVLSDPAFRRALINTVLLVVVAVHVEMAIGLLMALLFASFHVQYGLSPATLLVFVIGIILGVLRQRTSLSVCMLVHFLYNATLVLLPGS